MFHRAPEQPLNSGLAISETGLANVGLKGNVKAKGVDTDSWDSSLRHVERSTIDDERAVKERQSLERRSVLSR